MTLKTYRFLFWSVLSLTVLVLAWYAYLYSRGLVTFTLAPTTETQANSTEGSTVEPL